MLYVMLDFLFGKNVLYVESTIFPNSFLVSIVYFIWLATADIGLAAYRMY